MLLPGVLLAVFGFSQYRDGLARDGAIPVPAYMVAQIAVPKAAYISAVESLSRANPRDGEALLAAAEARLNAGADRSQLVGPLSESLLRRPASSRGWLLLSEALRSTKHKPAAQALTLALTLGPRDYYLAGPRARQSALLWSSLGEDARSMALAQTRLLWGEPLLRDQLRTLASSAEGGALVTRAFEQDDLRDINRWLAHEQRRKQSP